MPRVSPQEVVVAIEQREFQEHDFRRDPVDLPGVLFDRVAEIRERRSRLALEDRRQVQQADVVVVEDEQVALTTGQAELAAHHVDDAVGQQVELAERVTALAFDVNKRLPVRELPCQRGNDTSEVGFHCDDPP
jgi:hypothetical protein